jgi:hypothetical protein
MDESHGCTLLDGIHVNISIYVCMLVVIVVIVVVMMVNE